VVKTLVFFIFAMVIIPSSVFSQGKDTVYIAKWDLSSPLDIGFNKTCVVFNNGVPVDTCALYFIGSDNIYLSRGLNITARGIFVKGELPWKGKGEMLWVTGYKKLE